MVKQFKKTTFSLTGLLLTIVFSHPLWAEESVQLDNILVTASLQPISAQDVASSVTVITREEIEQKQVKYLSDLLRGVPGFSVSQAGGIGSQTQVRVRGAEANHLLVLIDGVRATDPAASDEFQYHFALTSNIERIEIIRGPQSAIWGGDAVAGVINIIRKKNVQNGRLSGNFETGSFSTVNASVDGGYAGDIFRINGGMSYLNADGTNISRLGTEKDGTENTNGNIALEFDAGEVVKLRFFGNIMETTSEYDDIDYFVTGLPTDADRVTESSQTFLSGEMLYEPLHAPWSGSFSINRMDSDNDNINDGVWASSSAAETLEYRLRGGVTFGAGETHNHRVNFALEREDINFHQRGQVSFYGDPNQNQSYNTNGYALEYVGKPATGFTWTLSGRLDDYSDFDNSTTWQLAASYQLSPALRLRGSLGTGSKAPTFTERFGFYEDFFIGNVNLKPESSQGWEIGLDSYWAEGQYELQLALFDQNLHDEIDGFVYDPATGFFTARNKTSDSKRKGIEAVFNVRLAKSFTASASYTYTDATEKNALRQSVRELRRPENMASIAANYRFASGRGNLNLNLNYNGSQQDIFFSPETYTSDRVDIDAYTVLDLAASWKLTPSLELTGRIDNLSDENYEEILGFVRPGRSVYAGLRGRFNF